MNSQEEKYKVKKHIHLFASWSASRATSTSPVNRFKVEAGQKILEKSFSTYIDMDHEIIYIPTSTQVCVAKAGRNGQNDRPNLLARICARARAHARAGGFFSN